VSRKALFRLMGASVTTRFIRAAVNWREVRPGRRQATGLIHPLPPEQPIEMQGFDSYLDTARCSAFSNGPCGRNESKALGCNGELSTSSHIPDTRGVVRRSHSKHKGKRLSLHGSPISQ
jgi:hypothetical protein